jgi:hypothetical protein
MLSARLIDMRTSTTGIRYEAGNEAHSFVSALASSYITELRDRSQWVVEQFGTLSEEEIRLQTATIFGSWPDDGDTGDREGEDDTWSE